MGGTLHTSSHPPPSSLRRTNLGSLRPGSAVNLERAAVVGGRNSGHLVQGHVDDTGEIVAKWAEGDSLWVRVAPPSRLLPYIVPKGYICVDGASLTVVDVDRSAGTFTFMLIAFTQSAIVLPRKAVGERVNLEVDVAGKYAAAGGGDAALLERLVALEKRVAELEGGCGCACGKK